MSRPLRLEHPGAIWHVTSRGNERRDVFRDDRDRHRWLELLARVVELTGWKLHAWVGMGNHYHLLVETPQPFLARGMRQLNGVYTQWFNRRHGRVGHLFQGRYKTVLVERESHLLELVRYVVLNPVRAGLVTSAADWPWSSYRATAGEAPVPPWLQTQPTLEHFGPDPAAATRRYREFVAEGRGVPSDPWQGVRGQMYLGSDAFVDEARRRARAHVASPENPRPQREVPPRLDELLPRLIQAVGATPAGLRSRGNVPKRAMIAWGLRRYAGATGAAIGAVLGVSAWRAARMAREGERLWPVGLESRLGEVTMEKPKARPDPEGQKPDLTP